MKKSYILEALLLVTVIGLGTMFAISKNSIVPSISVQDQSSTTGEVTVQDVVSAKSSWLVIQTNDEGVPGPVIGYVKINAGNNKNVKVRIDVSQATKTLYAMIHNDDGVKDKFDFPKNDQPLMYKMEMVAKVFKLN